MYEYAPHPSHPLEELEVFTGTIIGKHGGTPTKRQRESSTGMKDKYERDVQFIVDCITREHEGEALERSVACFSLATENAYQKTRGKIGVLRSWGYVAAGICIREVETFAGTAC